jgi:hypothetical protein
MDTRGSEYGKILDLVAKQVRFLVPYRGIVLSLDDTEKRGRVQCSVPELGWIGGAESPWCEPVYTNNGISLPEIDEVVEIRFFNGDPSQPHYYAKVGEVKSQKLKNHLAPTDRVIWERPDGSSYILFQDEAGVLKIQADEIDINGDSDYLVLYKKLAADINTWVTALKLHTHSGVETGGGSTAPASGISDLDISDASTTTIKTGG